MRTNAKQDKIIEILGKGMATPKEIASKLGKEYTEFKVQSMILTLARKGFVDKTKAMLLLRGTKMIKFLDVPFGVGKEE